MPIGQEQALVSENPHLAADPSLAATLADLARLAGPADLQPVWPAESWEALRRAGVPAWCVPPAYGGQGRTGADLLAGYEALAGACLTSCFILSQRDAACRRLRDSGQEALCRELLPLLARGESFATVGLSQLTTSRQHGQPALSARLTADALLLDGSIPWVTGAARADHFIIGAMLEDGRQILAVLPAGVPGVRIGPPLALMALQGSLTAEIQCEQVALDRKWILSGPAEKVLTPGRGGSGGLETSCLALGLAGAAVAYLFEEAEARPELRSPAERFEQVRRSIRADLHRQAREGNTPEAAGALRARANSLVLRASQAALTAAKGTGFLLQHPAQRWARQALFFLVWSCPGPVARATLASLACEESEGWAG
jgi:alkylation response protein AidB-like acyl-CoA dehydrogenase